MGKLTAVVVVFSLLVTTVSASHFPDSGEADDAVEDEMQREGLTIVDYESFFSVYGNRRIRNKSSERDFRMLPLMPDGQHDQQHTMLWPSEISFGKPRAKRQAEADEIVFSGDNPCESDASPCDTTTQDCIFDIEQEDGYVCECKEEYEESSTGACVEIPDSKKLYLTTVLNYVNETDLGDQTSTALQELQNMSQKAFSDQFSGVAGYKTLRVSEFRDVSGKTMVVYSIFFTGDVAQNTTIINAVAEAVLKMEHLKEILIGTTAYGLEGFTGIFQTLADTTTGNDAVDWCSSTSLYQCDDDRECNDEGLRYTCPCRPAFVDVQNECVRVNEYQYDLYAYGMSGDKKMPKGDDETRKISIPTGFPVGNELQYTAYVGINGLVTFGNRDSGLSQELKNNRMMVSPYNSDIITFGTQGEVWYKLYTDVATDSSVFEKASREMTEFLQQEYKASLVMVVTWENVSHIQSRNRDEETATFQAVFVYDGTTSYALMYYKTGTLNWVYRKSSKLTIGVSKGSKEDVKKSFYSNTVEGFTELDRIKGNTGRRGMWLYSVGEKYSVDKACEDWYQENLPFREEILRMSWTVAWCPCSWFGLGRSWILHRYISESDTVCYRLSRGRSRRRYGTYGRECCYRRPRRFASLTLVQSLPDAGALTRFNPAIRVLQTQHREQDRDPHDLCCFQTTEPSKYCRMYYELRPVGSCRFSWWFFFAFMFGDPHIQTLDGKEYSFNGWGEYNLVILPSSDFVLQGRTDKGETDNGTRIDATIFTAFAAKENNSKIYIELDPQNRTTMIIYAARSNDEYIDYSLQFQENADFLIEEEEFTLKRENSSLIVDFAVSEISLTISVGVKLLDIGVDMPTEHRNQTSGLFGNFNGDPNDDFILPNGTVLSPNITERQIFEEFGSLWAVRDDESVFRYDSRKGPADFRHANFTPIFVDEFSGEERAEAVKVCGGADKLACIYDFLATGSQAVATATRQSKDTADETDATLQNTVPELNATDIVTVNISETVQIDLLGTDEDADDTVVYYPAEDASGSFQLDNLTGIVNYTATMNSQNDKLGFYVADSKNAVSPVKVIAIRLCTGCNNQGYCHPTESRSTNNSQTFQVAVCVCDPGWTGEDCEVDIDGCDETPCIPGQNCTDLLPDQEAALGRGYNCTDCPAGFEVPENGSKCSDIDECSVSPNETCPDICNNTEGSYECSCSDGYRLGDDGKSCNDINECFEKSAGCQQICVNFDGGFNCSCEEGYTLVESNGTCIQNEATQATCETVNCTQGCKVNATDHPECFCYEGFEQNTTDNTLCDDVDECTLGICNQKCDNSVGSFACSCYIGFQLEADGVTCVPCQDLTYGENCNQRCKCNGRSTECDSVTGCVCEAGWTGTNCEEDLDECEINPNTCGSALESCLNTNGSYRCNCLDGYSRNPSGVCADINECEVNVISCGDLEDCTNTPGSFFCDCKAGYQSGGTGCTDENECENGVAACEQICVNVVGSFNCECSAGFVLDADRSSCKKAEDVCAESNLNCDYECTLDDSDNPVCFCQTGFKLATDQATCLDINECDTDNGGCSDVCTNSDGGFQCSCPVGKRLVDQKDCVECSSGTFGANCQSECACGKGALRCDPVDGCQCKDGWTGNKCDQDINECDTPDVQNECQAKNALCNNFDGRYRCDCAEGYQENISICEDINECDSTPSPCSQRCENFAGSFRCLCNSGFTLDTATNQCNDIDECALDGTNRCTQKCTNSIGSYRCSCDPGFNLEADGFTCTARTDCATNNTCPTSNGGCSVQAEGDKCFCNSGYVYDNNTNTCNFTVPDYCNTAEDPCEQNCTKTDDAPYFKCSCEIGYELSSDGRTCIECQEGKYGDNCADTCNCRTQNTQFCNKTNGVCECKSGWNGTDCSQDINECADAALYSCVADSQCVNTNGSYICVCKDGFFKASDGNCTECPDNTFGTNCQQTCQCVSVNTESCNKVNGTCSCKAGWESANCSVDINECSAGTHNCSGERVICKNNDGGFDCVCEPGYQKNASGACVDLDECLDSDANDCPQLCNNTVGNFTCSCAPGYSGDGRNCTECEEGKWGVDCLSDCSCPSNRPDCNNVDGTCGCNPGYTGDNCDVDIDECIEEPPCGDYSDCTNVIPPERFKCACWPGYQDLVLGGRNCTECPDGKFGNNCTGVCDCHPDHATCDKSNGTCHCKDGFKGDRCYQDVNECTEVSPPPCGNNSDCTNKIGTFECSCKPGYQDLVSNGKNCVECPDGTWGNKCSQTCDCNTNHSTCNIINGNCDCFPGYEGDRCDNDTDECAESTPACGENSDCTNTVGSYNCSCHDGYQDPVSNGRNCTDVDECQVNNGDCAQICTNSPGYFNCSCRDGFGLASDGSCDKLSNIPFELVIALNLTDIPDEVFNNTSSAEYVKLAKEVREALFDEMKKTVKRLVEVIIKSMRKGSLIVGAEAVVSEDEPGSDGLAQVVKAAGDLKNLTVRGQNGEVANATVKGELVSENLCDTFTAIDGCTPDEVCEVIEGLPTCRALPTGDSNFELIIGLGVGVPLFFIIVGVIVFIVYMKIKSRKADTDSDDEHDQTLSGVFSRKVATRAPLWDPSRGLYTPDSLSSASSDGGYKQRGKRNGAFKAGPEYDAWNDRVSQSTTKRGADGGPSNFSWDVFYKEVLPDQPFAMPRPKVAASTNPAYASPRKDERGVDSYT